MSLFLLVMKLGGPRGLCGHFRRDNFLLLLPQIETKFLGRPARNLITPLTELSYFNVADMSVLNFIN
jgi:hypothetical protein